VVGGEFASAEGETPVVGHRFAKADAGVEGEVGGGDAGPEGGVGALEEVGADGSEDVGIVCRGRGGIGGGDVHEDEGGGLAGGGARGGDGGEEVGVVGAGGDVVDDLGAGLEGFGGDLGGTGVDRDFHFARETRDEAMEDGEEPAELFVGGDGLDALAEEGGGLRAEVEDGGAGGDEGEGVGDGGLGGEDAVGEGVGGDVDDAHEGGGGGCRSEDGGEGGHGCTISARRGFGCPGGPCDEPLEGSRGRDTSKISAPAKNHKESHLFALFPAGGWGAGGTTKTGRHEWGEDHEGNGAGAHGGLLIEGRAAMFVRARVEV
jgi:hypothetical protein